MTLAVACFTDGSTTEITGDEARILKEKIISGTIKSNTLFYTDYIVINMRNVAKNKLCRNVNRKSK